LFLQCGRLSPVLLKPAFLFILFQNGSEFSQKMWIIFHSIVCSKNKGVTIIFQTLYTKNKSLMVQRISMQCTLIFSTSYSTVLTIIVSTYALSILKKTSSSCIPFCEKIMSVTDVSVATRGKRGSFLCALLQYLYTYVTCYMVLFILCTGSFNK
jgi:hypothetical protein